MLSFVATDNVPKAGFSLSVVMEVTKGNTTGVGALFDENVNFHQINLSGLTPNVFWDTAASGPAVSAALSANVVGKIASVYNGSVETAYTNGVPGTPVAMGGQGANSATITIGNNAGGSPAANACIRFLRIYSIPLTPAQVQQL
jgi:hypothetical protein